MAQINFNAQQYAPDTGMMDPVPAGWYTVMITESENKPTKDAAVTRNFYLQATFTIADGPHAGRKLFHRFNIGNNTSPKAREIANSQLSAVCYAVKVLNAVDSSQLHNIPLKVRVRVKPADGQYEASNEITSFVDVSQATPTAPAPSAVVVPPAPNAVPYQPAPLQPWQQAPATVPPAVGGGAWQAPATPQPWQQPAAPTAVVPPAPVQPAPIPQQPAPVQGGPAWANGAPMQGAAPAAPAAPTQVTPAPAAPAAMPPWMQPQQPA